LQAFGAKAHIYTKSNGTSWRTKLGQVHLFDLMGTFEGTNSNKLAFNKLIISRNIVANEFG
jgi:hypothetical protein